MNLTNYLKSSLALHVFNGVAYATPVGIHLALFTSPTTDAGGGVEVVGDGYVRGLITSTVVSGEAINNNVVGLGTATADWGAVTHVAIFDGSVGGNMLMHARLPVSLNVTSGQAVSFDVNKITLSFN